MAVQFWSEVTSRRDKELGLRRAGGSGRQRDMDGLANPARQGRGCQEGEGGCSSVCSSQLQPDGEELPAS